MMQEITLTVHHIYDIMYQFGQIKAKLNVAGSNLFFDCTTYFTFNDISLNKKPLKQLFPKIKGLD